jgi:hypothetical protein
VGTELLVAGMLIMAGGYDGKPLDDAELERWIRAGCRHARVSGDRRVRLIRLLKGKRDPTHLHGVSAQS